MKCCSRYTIGIIIGSCYLLASIIGSIAMTVWLLEEYDEDSWDPASIVIILAICSVTGLLSGLLILGIVKRRHNLMLPWLIIYTFVFLFLFLMFFFGTGGFDDSTTGIFIQLSVGLVIIILQIFIFRFFWILFRAIRRENTSKLVPNIASPQVKYQAQLL